MAGRAGLQLLGGRAPGAVALVAPGGAVTYGELDARVERRIDDLGLAARSVVVLAGPTGVELVVTYLALLRAGHVPLLAGDYAERLADAWRPAAVVTAEGDGDGDGGGVRVEHLRAERRPLHPDLALLLSTSGSTGSPKLVRLSAGNVASNARAIASYLRLGPGDRGITSLPLHYCYGLSVLHSHLVAGASVVLTTASVVDPCFARAMDDHGVTNLAGVPHTFDLLERAGAERVRVPSLRFLTQAGGRMAPDAVARWHRRAAGWGADLFVMYGQTEATARMAYLPPALAAVRPGAVGVPIPGGALEVRPVPGRTGVDLAGDVGELVYTGPNVMLGYATTDADLVEGATLTELRTGDLGRFDAEHGVFEVVGRLGRIVKPFGLRLDLDAVEAALAARNVPVTAAGDDELLVLAVAPGGGPGPDGVDRAHVAAAAARVTGLPASRVAVVEGDAPRTSAGKTDYGALLAAGRAAAAATGPAAPVPGSVPERSPVAAAYASLLGGSIGPATTFVSAGGDSLSYVECSLLLERALGRLPDDWHLRTVAELDALAAGAPARRPAGADRVDTTVVLRAVGICAVVATHMGVVFFPGGAHLLLAVVGFNLSRFQLALDGTGERVRAGLRSVARVALPTMAWTAGALLVSDSYGLPTLALVNNYAGGPGHADGTWHFWFIEAFVQLGLAATALLAVPAVRRLERRHPYWFPLGLLLAALQLRTVGWFGIDDPANLRFRTHGIAWFFVLGWLVHRSTAPWQKGLTTVVAIASVTGFFGRPQREWFILAGLLTLAWCRRVPCPRPLQPVVATLAGASFWIFVSHFQLWRPLARLLPLPAAYPATLLAGVALWAATDHATRHARTLLVHRRPRPPTPTADQAAPAPPPPPAADRPAPTTPGPVARPAGDRPVEAPV